MTEIPKQWRQNRYPAPIVGEDAMSKVLDSLKAALQIAFGLVILAIILLNFWGNFSNRRR
ncbi:MAG: hypothetical protein ACREDD_04655 [Methylocella sp.]